MGDRKLSEALSLTPELTPEAKRFITGNSPKLEQVRSSTKTGEKDNKPKKSATSSGDRAAKKQDTVEERVLVNLGTRIEKKVKAKLDEAVFKRKLAKKLVWRQQEIVENAILDWLKRNPS